jgi:SAM-dependent methyltransferase
MDPAHLTAGIDIERPSQARIYDYLLGGSLNFAADREAARQLIAMVPDVPLVAQANRAFLRRAVRFLADTGVRQFLDLGSGVPTRGNVHEIVQQVAPDSRVVYVDIDPVAVAHSRQILAGNDRATAIQQDVRRPEDILDHPEVRQLLDLARPVAALVVSVMHFVADSDDPAGILGRLRDALAPDSYLVLSHITADGRPDHRPPSGQPDHATSTAPGAGQSEHSGQFARPRSRADVERFFAGFELVKPGLVPVEQWRPDSLRPEVVGESQALLCMQAGVGRKA